MSKQDTITFQPIPANRRMLDNILGENPRRGDMTRVINACLTRHLPYIEKVQQATVEPKNEEVEP